LVVNYHHIKEEGLVDSTYTLIWAAFNSAAFFSSSPRRLAIPFEKKKEREKVSGGEWGKNWQITNILTTIHLTSVPQQP
jgi:hypothetical protein